MVNRIVKYIIALLLVGTAAGYLFYFNRHAVTVTLAPGKVWEAPLAIVLMAVFFLGTAMLGAVAIYLGAKHSFKDWQDKLKRKRLTNHSQLLQSGSELLALDSFSSAKTNLEKIVNQDSSNVLAWLALAQVYEKQGKTDDCLRVLERARLNNAGSYLVLFKIAEINQALLNYTAAYDNLKIVLNAHPKNILALKKIVTCCKNLKRYDEAIAYTKEVLSAAYGKEQEAYNQELAELELRYTETKHSENSLELRSALEAILRKHRDFPPALDALAKIERGQSKLQAASKLWTRAYQVTREIVYLKSIASMWLDANDSAAAVDAVKTAINYKKAAELSLGERVFLANLFLAFNKSIEAKDELKQIETQGKISDNMLRHVNLVRASILHHEGRHAEANRILKSIIERDKCITGYLPSKTAGTNGSAALHPATDELSATNDKAILATTSNLTQ
ncbi:MAG: hypothetical protein IT291_04245 [Deltaproteobacteria bacterium]|nr:hypothetical protein [Deltaproteobacteria bacterium]